MGKVIQLVQKTGAKKKRLKTKHKVAIIVEIIGAIAIVVAAIIGVCVGNDKEENAQGESIKDSGDFGIQIGGDIRGNGINIINGDNNIIDDSLTINNYETKVTSLDYDFENKSVEQLLEMANKACINEEYDYAFDIYSRVELEGNALAMINLGYIYENGLAYVGVDYERARNCYEQSDCMEAKRNLLSLYLKTKDTLLCDLFEELLWVQDDQITWDYVAECLFGQTWESYSNDNEINKDEFSFELDKLYDWEYTYSYYTGANPPCDTATSRWIFQGIDYAVGDGYNHSYDIYRKQVVKYSKEINMLDKMYYIYESD